MGRSRGGLTTKIHAVVDANGLPILLKLAAGQAHETIVSIVLLDIGAKAFSRCSCTACDTYVGVTLLPLQHGAVPASNAHNLGGKSEQQG